MSFANIDLEAQKEPLLKGKDNDANYTSPDELDTIIGKPLASYWYLET